MLENPGWWAVAVSLLALVYTIVSNRSNKTAAKLLVLEATVADKADASACTFLAEKVDRLEDRATRIEKDMEHLPDKDATNKLNVALARIEGEMSTLSERIKPIAAMSARLQEKLIDGMGGA